MQNQSLKQYHVSQKALLDGLKQAMQHYAVAALTEKQGQAIYDFISDVNNILWECWPTVLSPKKFFFPQDEVLVDYTADGKVTARLERKPMVLFGVHPCDLNGIKILNEAFADGHGDPNYLMRMEAAVVIGLDCVGVCDEHAFCAKTQSHEAKGGYDVMLYPVSDGFVADVATEKGQAFIKKFIKTTEAKSAALELFKKEKQKNFASLKPFKNLEKFPEMFEKSEHHSVWKQEGDRCVSCGSCIMVCPTCYCFDVVDELALSLKKGERMRRWDACMLSPFAKVAGGENFRPTAEKRLHHRINRKFNYLMKKHGQSVCVGCGRCVRACLAKISPKTIAETLNGEKE
jgi:sulfhydrogenase subunit beta (sulfur reductase)